MARGGLGMGACVTLTARPRKLCLASVAVNDPTNGANGANGAAVHGESDFTIW